MSKVFDKSETMQYLFGSLLNMRQDAAYPLQLLAFAYCTPLCPSIFPLLDTREIESVDREIRKEEEGKDGLKIG